jgi:hypothetical protein
VNTLSTDNESKPNTNNNTTTTETAQPSQKPAEFAKDMAQKTYGDFLGAYKSFSETTSQVIQQAASVLEAEVAAGVRIAQQTENKFPQIEKFRSEQPDAVMQRFRRDAHEVVDIFIDVVGTTLRSVPNLSDPNLLRVGNVTVKPVQVPQAQHPIITAAQPVKAGGIAEIQISFENSRNVETEEFKLFSTDLINNSGERLPAGLVKFTPAALKIAPFQTMQATVTIAVPEETAPGTYSGLVLASNMSELRSEIVIKVE